MIKLLCTGNYHSAVGSFKAGQQVELADNVAEFLLRDSPGSFEVIATEPDLGNIITSAETATGLTVPDRRARGGGVR